MKAYFLVLVVFALVSILGGCSEDRLKIVPVAGVVTLNGEPLADANVTFDPRATADDGIAGIGSFGRTDSNGRFELQTYTREPGAVQATHRAAIRTMLATQGPDGRVKITRRELLPSKYHENTTLTFDVPPGGTDQANFDLKTGR